MSVSRARLRELLREIEWAAHPGFVGVTSTLDLLEELGLIAETPTGEQTAAEGGEQR